MSTYITHLPQNPESFNVGNNTFQIGTITDFLTSDATPTTPSQLSINLTNNSVVTMWIRGMGRETTTNADVFEFEVRNSWKRTSAGTSSRLGTANGMATNVVNSFAATKPSITFGDPSATNIATVIITGKAATSITWYIYYHIQTGV